MTAPAISSLGSPGTRIAVVPRVLALRSEYASLIDPVPELRAAVSAARQWSDIAVTVNGSARRTVTSPGPFDERAMSFDDALLAALRSADVAALRAVEQELAAELWADTTALAGLAEALEGHQWSVEVDYEDAPHGVAWWVLRYERDGV